MAALQTFHPLVPSHDMERTIWISSLYPKYDDLHGPLPPDRKVTVREILNPTLLRVADKHSGLENAKTDHIYELERYVRPQGSIDKGDDPDLQAMGSGNPDIFLSIEHIVLMNQRNINRDKHRIYQLRHRGNHDIKIALASEDEVREAGLNIYRAIRTVHPDQRPDTDIHGHEVESPYMVNVPTKIASGVHDKIASRGRDAAAVSKDITKITTGAVGIDHSLKFLSWYYDSNIVTGHTHRVKLAKLGYRKKFNIPTIKREISDRAMTGVFASVLWLHRTGALEGIITEAAIPGLQKSYASGAEDEARHTIRDFFKETARQAVQAVKQEFNIEDMKKLKGVGRNLFMGTMLLLHKAGLLDAAIEKLIIPAITKLAAAKLATDGDPKGQGKIEEVHGRIRDQFMHVLIDDPQVELFKGMTLKNMRPRFFGKKIPKKTASGHTEAVIRTPGCFLDGRATYEVVFADTGQPYTLDWLKVREFVKPSLRDMPNQPLAGNDIVVNHFLSNDVHPDTLKQLKLYYKYKGALSDEDTEKYSRPAELNEMATVKMSRKGIEEVTLPNGRPLVLPKAAEAHEFIPPHLILGDLEKISPLTAKDLKQRMDSDSRIKKLFEPEEEFVFVATRRPKPDGRKPTPPQYAPIPVAEREYSMV